MARISASIPEDLKDALYQAATDHNQAISHIIVDALRAHFGTHQPTSPPPNALPSLGGGEEIHHKLDLLTCELRELREQLTGRTPPRGARFF